MSQRGHSSESLWAITSFFNPCKYRRRSANYRVFRAYLTVPLVTVELSFDETFELEPDDAEILVQISAADIMWQKERLLNVALRALPESCRQIAWLDCDIIISDPNWATRVQAALKDAMLVQAFDRVCYLDRNASDAETIVTPNAGFWQRGLVHAVLKGQPFLTALRASVQRTPENCALGFAWAARRELLEEHGFYDACIIGGGDVALTCAAFGCLEELAHRQRFNFWQKTCYEAWASAFFASVRGSVASIAVPIYHLWHGEMSHRRSYDRHVDLSCFSFDPTQDIAISASGAWRWSSSKQEMHNFVRNYFVDRQEDG